MAVACLKPAFSIAYSNAGCKEAKPAVSKFTDRPVSSDLKSL